MKEKHSIIKRESCESDSIASARPTTTKMRRRWGCSVMQQGGEGLKRMRVGGVWSVAWEGLEGNRKLKILEWFFW